MILGGLLSGVGVGVAVVVIARGLFPRPPSLVAALEPHRSGGAGLEPGRVAVPGRRAVGRRLVPVVRATTPDQEELSRHLRVVGCTIERHAFDKLLLAWVFAALPIGAALAVGWGGVAVPWGLVVVGAPVLALIGFVVPDVLLRSEARARRRDFRHAVAAYLDLVATLVAAGSGTESALHDAAHAGDGWAFGELRGALSAARLRGETPWEALSRVGTDLGVDDLRELGASVSLAGEHGARVRRSLMAKAVSTREHLIAEAETRAQETTEKMAVPVVLMLFAFLLFVLYPALVRVLEGL